MSISFKHIDPRIHALIVKAGRLADAHGFHVFVVGGLVRDCLLHRESLDLDLTVEGDGIAYAQLLAIALKGKLIIHQPFLTATISLTDGLIIDIVTARCESYAKPGILPTVKPASINEDLYRRDFTINAIAFAINKKCFGEIVDPFGGMSDLQKKCLRVLHSQSFIDDPTRLLRAIRYESRLNFRLEAGTLQLFQQAVKDKVWLTVKPPRYFAEFIKVLQESHSIKAVKRLDQLQALVVPGLRLSVFSSDLRLMAKILKQHTEVNLVLVWLIVLHQFKNEGDLEFAFKQVGISHQMMKVLVGALDRAKTLGALSVKVISRARIYQRLQRLPMEAIVILKAQASETTKKRIDRYLLKDRHFKILVTGDDLKQLGIVQGVMIKETLNKIIAQSIDEQVLTRAGQLSIAQANLRRHDVTDGKSQRAN